MATLWKRASPSQYRMLRAIAGAVKNAADAHHIEVPRTFARSVAKRATGTLTAQWPDVLAAKANRRQIRARNETDLRALRFPNCMEGVSKGGRLIFLRRSPLSRVWDYFSAQMRMVKVDGTPQQAESIIKILRLLDEASKEYDRLATPPQEQR